MTYKGLFAAPLSNKRVQLWGINSDYSIKTCIQSKLDPEVYVGWKEFPGKCTKIRGVTLPDKRLKLWGIAPDGTLWTAEESSDSFTEWKSIVFPGKCKTITGSQLYDGRV